MKKARWKLTNEEYEYIKGEVTHIFIKYRINCIPVSGFEIASKMGIKLVPYSTLTKLKLKKAMETSADGFYCEENGLEMIYYNDIGKSYKRQNMTILHEIGHCVLDHIGHSEHEEEEAKFFAKYAIAPPVLIHKVGVKSPQDIYDRFDISFEAAVYAYQYYMLWKRRMCRLKRLEIYEKEMLSLYSKSS